QEEREAAPDVDVLVERMPQPLHGRVAEHLKQRRRQGQDEPHEIDLGVRGHRAGLFGRARRRQRAFQPSAWMWVNTQNASGCELHALKAAAIDSMSVRVA